MPHDIFISYAREDRERVRLIAEELARRGHDVWWDPRLRGGQDFRDAIEDALKSARCVVVAWSRHSLDSDFVIDEAERGKQRGILLPVFIDAGIGPPLGFGGIHTNDLSGWLADPSRPEPFDQFAGDLADLLGRTPGAGPPPPAAHPPPPATWPRPPSGRRLSQRQTAMLAGAGLVVLVAAGGIVYSMANPPTTMVAEIARDSARAASARAGTTAADSAGPSVDSAHPGPGDTLPLLSGPRTGMLVGLRCVLPGESRNPIAERAERLAPAAYRVNVQEHVLVHADGRPVRVVQAERVGRELQSRRLIVLHHTAGSARSTEAYLENPAQSASAHLLIHRDGSVTQLVPFDVIAYHAGAGEWNGLRSLNSHSIGIEMENLGMLEARDGAWYFGSRQVAPDSVERFAGRSGTRQGWHRYTDAQIRAVFEVSCALRRAYPTLETLVGDREISQRKTDPGPGFPLDAMRSRLFPARPSD